MSRLDFQLQKVATGSRARAARFRTLHNEVITPLFMPVGTHATVRGQRFDHLHDSGSQILLANTYHLLLRPGQEVFKKFGGIHKFMQWPRSVLTDSGGFQIFAMPNERVMSEEGAKFLSYVDGKHVFLTPELSIETQRAIGSDIMMVLDQCVPSTVEHKEAKAAMELSQRWALRSLAARGDSPQSLFAIVQGACYLDLRQACADFLTQHPFDGFALGGLAVGETKQEREDTVEFAAALLPADRPRYLMGVGTPIDLLEAVHRGMDMFDCIIPTAHSEQGVAYTWTGKKLMRRGAYRLSEEPLDPLCTCFVCENYSRAYLHHLIKVGEPLGRQLIGQHNIFFFHDLMRTMRERILDDTFLSFYQTTREQLVAADVDYPITREKRKKVRPLELGDYEIAQAAAGFFSIRQKSSGETMHSTEPPEVEAQKLYVDQSRLVERTKEESELVLWDVGMGAGTNVMMTIHAYEAAVDAGHILAPLKIYSFENDLNSLRLALSHLDRFKYLRHGAPNAILERGEWKSKKYSVEWKLLTGDFLNNLNLAPAPGVIYFDPFSLKSDGPLWQFSTFQRIHDYLERSQERPSYTELFTYSASTAVRSTLLAAGFYLAKGQSTGVKSETTIACTAGALPFRHQQMLTQEWWHRWQRSDAREPIASEGCSALYDKAKSHPQFAQYFRSASS